MLTKTCASPIGLSAGSTTLTSWSQVSTPSSSVMQQSVSCIYLISLSNDPHLNSTLDAEEGMSKLHSIHLVSLPLKGSDIQHFVEVPMLGPNHPRPDSLFFSFTQAPAFRDVPTGIPLIVQGH